MKRVCFVLQVRPDRLDEYKARHRDVWPEMLAALRETGWNNYSLSCSDGLLVGYLENERLRSRSLRNGETRSERSVAEADGRILSAQPEGKLPDRAMEPLEEVFHL